MDGGVNTNMQDVDLGMRFQVIYGMAPTYGTQQYSDTYRFVGAKGGRRGGRWDQHKTSALASEEADAAVHEKERAIIPYGNKPSLYLPLGNSKA